MTVIETRGLVHTLRDAAQPAATVTQFDNLTPRMQRIRPSSTALQGLRWICSSDVLL
jgi:hypothetical protein